MSLKNQAVSGIKWGYTSKSVTTALQLLQTVFMARLLEPKDFGLMAMLMVVVGFAQTFTDMGISKAIIYRQDATHNQLSSLYWLNVFSGITVFGLVMAASPHIVFFFNEPGLSRLIFWVSLAFIISPISHQFYILLQKELKFDRLARIEMVSVAIGTVVAVSSAIAGQGVFSFIWGHLAVVSSKTMFAVFSWNTWGPGLHFNREDLRGYISFGLYEMGKKSVNYFVLNLDLLLIGKLLGSEALGFYSVAFQLVMRPFNLISPVISRVSFPVFSKIQNDNTLLKHGYLKITQMVASINIPLYMGMFVVADPLMYLILGDGWEPAVSVFKILVWQGIFYSLEGQMGNLLLSKGRADIGFWYNLACLPLYAATMYIGSRWGINGIALSLLLTDSAVVLPVDLWIYRFLVKMRPVEYIGTVAPFAAFSILMATGVIAVNNLITINNAAMQLAILTAAGTFMYLSFIFLFKRSFLREVLSLIKGQ